MYLCSVENLTTKPFVVWSQELAEQWCMLNYVNKYEMVEVKDFISCDFEIKDVENILRQKIKNYFGEINNINLVIFKARCEYNDNWYEHNPVLILLDKEGNEVINNIEFDDFVPYESYKNSDGSYVQIPDITFKY